jgi:hypothetical protein
LIKNCFQENFNDTATFFPAGSWQPRSPAEVSELRGVKDRFFLFTTDSARQWIGLFGFPCKPDTLSGCYHVFSS